MTHGFTLSWAQASNLQPSTACRNASVMYKPGLTYYNNNLLNCTKTGPPYYIAFPQSQYFTSNQLWGQSICMSESVRDLGVIFINNLQLDIHICKIYRTASFSIHKIGKLRNYLDQNSTERLIHAYVTSHLDYCNSLLFGLPTSQIPLQRSQNSAAWNCLVCRVKRWENITPFLRSLHRLPVTQRIKYKILLLLT